MHIPTTYRILSNLPSNVALVAMTTCYCFYQAQIVAWPNNSFKADGLAAA
jgi:hypothetical protein